jgi:hypothetical protein
MSKGIVTTQKVKVCSFTGDPGCLGYPAWIDHPACDCIYEEVDFHFCDCGGSDVYGEMWHEEDCPAVEHSVEPTVESVGASPAVVNQSESEFPF